MQEVNLPFGGDQQIGDLAEAILSAIPPTSTPTCASSPPTTPSNPAIT